MRYLPYLTLLLAMPLMAANIWKWRDANGVVHFSDQPVPGAEQVNLQLPSTYAPSPVSEAKSSSSSSSAAFSYSNVEIWKPSAELTIANTVGVVSVAVRVEPQLSSEHHLALYMDGRLVPGFPPQGMEYDITEVDRGEHSLTLAVLDAKGNQIVLSSPVRFYVQQPSVLRKP
jgi:hypothetical protein